MPKLKPEAFVKVATHSIACQAPEFAASRRTQRGKRAMLPEIQTPAIVVDIDVAKQNVQDLQAYADAHGLTVRPHIKTHKLPAIAEIQLRAGAVGITCQKVSEAEAMAVGSELVRDVLIT
jgi:D-serine deaminase-like pyridoxal phosphate-dependent protein